jgi:ADP-ribose pyrophosphatase YjhB (NUDIX family)
MRGRRGHPGGFTINITHKNKTSELPETCKSLTDIPVFVTPPFLSEAAVYQARLKHQPDFLLITIRHCRICHDAPGIRERENMSLPELIDALESQIANPARGLPQDAFLFISRLTPMINVDLLVRNDRNETLLTWREDEYYGPGWHVPGGIVRFKETMASRIAAVAASELGASVAFAKDPLTMVEIMHPSRDTRGHFISVLYDCRLTGPLNPDIEYKTGPARHGQWAWHAESPLALIAEHAVYRRFIRGDF